MQRFFCSLNIFNYLYYLCSKAKIIHITDLISQQTALIIQIFVVVYCYMKLSLVGK